MILLMGNFLVICTWNTKGEELDFVCQELARRNHNPIRLDFSAKKARGQKAGLLGVVDAAKEKLTTLAKQQPISGAVSVGGGTNLGMAIRVMTELPLMMPKVIASTMIANSLTMLRTHKDIIYVQVPCDFGWLNPVSRAVLTNCVALVTSMDGAMGRALTNLLSHHQHRYNLRISPRRKGVLG